MATTGRANTKNQKPPADQPVSSAPQPARSAPQPARSAPQPGGAAPVKRQAKPKGDDPVLERVAGEDLDLRDDPKPAPPAAGGPKPGKGGVDAALAASQSDLAKLQRARRVRLYKALALTAIALVLITFILQNADPIDLRVLAWTVPVRLIWVIVVSALLGALAGYLVGRPDKNLLLHGPSRRQEDTR